MNDDDRYRWMVLSAALWSATQKDNDPPGAGLSGALLTIQSINAVAGRLPRSDREAANDHQARLFALTLILWLFSAKFRAKVINFESELLEIRGLAFYLGIRLCAALQAARLDFPARANPCQIDHLPIRLALCRANG